MKLLIADDNAELRALLRQLCANGATQTRECADGCEAVQAFGEFQPDWTIMDLTMPRLDGLAATRQIIAGSPSARIIVLTENHGPEFEECARAAGACAFVSKADLHLLLVHFSQPTTANQTTV